LKILQVISHYVPAFRYGGPLQVAHSLGKSLVAAGHAVTVCTTNLKDAVSLLDVPVDTPVDVDGVRVYYERVPGLRRWGFSPGLARRLRAEITSADIVFAHTHYQFAGWVGARTARILGKPYLLFTHGSFRMEAIRSSSPALKRVYLRLFEKRNCEAARFLVFNSEEEMADSFFSSLGRVVPNGVNPADFASLPTRGGFRSKHPTLSSKMLFM
jgi:glycosyltransferase involved in cell wall biosynthesis